MNAPPRLLLLVAALLAPAFAGCVQDAPAPPAAAPEDTVVITEPGDNAALAAGSDMGWHVHDYWEGQDRFTAVDDEVQVGGWSCECDDIRMRFRGSPGQLVPLGATALEVVVTWTESGEGRHGPPELWVKSADAREASRVGFVTSGVPIAFNTTNERADPPHQVLSRWEFWFVLPAVGGEAQFAGDVRVYGEAVRGLPIPPFPPHPDLWKGETEIALFEESVGPLVQVQDPAEGSRSCHGDCLRIHVPMDGVIVPWDATEVLVTLTYAPGAPAGLGLAAHGGDTWEMTAHPATLAPPLGLSWRVPVTPETGDSPYAGQSLWEFEVVIDEPTPKKVFAGGYTLTAVARKA